MYDNQFCIDKENSGGKSSKLICFEFRLGPDYPRLKFSGVPQILHTPVRYVRQATIKLFELHRRWWFCRTFESSMNCTVDEEQQPNRLEAKELCLTTASHDSDQVITHISVDPMLITALTTVQHWTLFWASWNHFTPSHPVYLWTVSTSSSISQVISSLHVSRLTFHHFSSVPMRATCISYLVLLDLMTLIIFSKVHVVIFIMQFSPTSYHFLYFMSKKA
jgi:hypothetical protein